MAINARYWDDWHYYFNHDYAEFQSLWIGDGKHFLSKYWFFAVNHPWIMRLTAYSMTFASAWFVYRLLKVVDFFSDTEARLIGLLFLFLPFNSARVALATFEYAFSHFFFFLASLVLLEPRMHRWRVLCIPLFILSFGTPSFLVYYAAPIGVLYLREVVKDEGIGIFTTAKWALRRLVFLVIPFAYWFTHERFFPARAGKAEYLAIKNSGIARGLTLLLIFSVIGVALWLRYRDGESIRRYTIMTSLGLLLLGLGAFPYVAIGHLATASDWLLPLIPGQSDWSSRHQLLLPLGVAILLCGIGGILSHGQPRRFLKTALAISVALNFAFSLEYAQDSLKQEQLVKAFRSELAEVPLKVVLIDDLALRFNARGRSYRGYEWEGLLTRALGDDAPNYLKVDANSPDLDLLESVDAILQITAVNGRLKSILTRDLGIQVSIRMLK